MNSFDVQGLRLFEKRDCLVHLATKSRREKEKEQQNHTIIPCSLLGIKQTGDCRVMLLFILLGVQSEPVLRTPMPWALKSSELF